MVNPAVQLCKYYAGSSGHAKPETIKGGGGVNMSKGDLMWETKDGKNDYLVRLDRFERFTKKLKQLEQKKKASPIFLRKPQKIMDP